MQTQSRPCWTTISCDDRLKDTCFDMRTLAIFWDKIMPVRGWVSNGLVLFFFLFFLKFLTIVFLPKSSKQSCFCTALQFLSVNLANVWPVEVYVFSKIHWNHVWLVRSAHATMKLPTELCVITLPRVHTGPGKTPFLVPPLQKDAFKLQHSPVLTLKTGLIFPQRSLNLIQSGGDT